MKNLILTFIALSFLTGCAMKVTPLKGKYLEKPYEIISDNSKDVVWDKIIDFFAQKGISIKIIDRSSGLIISDKSKLTWTFESKKGLPLNNKAFVVLEKHIDPGPNKPIIPNSVIGDWNVRIKEIEGKKTLINVNLVNIYARRVSEYKSTYYDYEIKALSTGVFEKSIAEIIK